MTDVLTIRSDSLPDHTRVIGFRGSEALSRPYVFEIFLQIGGPEAHEVDIGAAVGAKVALVASRDDDRAPFVFAGIFSEVSLLHETEERAVLRAVLVPRLWRLSQSLHSRIFTRKKITEIIEAVLKDNGLSASDYALRLSAQYRPEEHVCQYKESDLDFLSRWMEREGLYYFFEHHEEGEKLIITDNKAYHKELASSPVRYFPQGGQDVTAGEHLESFVCRHRQLPATVRFKDYDYTKPTLDISGSAPVSTSGSGEIHLHGARLFTPDAAKRLANLRAEELKSRERVFSGSGTALHLRAGHTFSLTDHPRAAFDTTYLAVEVEHQGNQMAGARDLQRLTGLDDGGVYRVHVTAIPADVQFRAEERTPWPRIYGTEHGTVDGEADTEYAQIDEHGRYLVRFAFDESDLDDGKASTWVRMMQPHGGGIEGWHFPLRKGTEVLFTFLGGDPDRPVIAGVVPNALTPSPVTRANHTRNVIQTGGRNRIEMEDKAGYERITISTPHADTMIRMGSPNDQHELIVRTNENALLETGGRWDVQVAKEKYEKVLGATTEHYLNKKDELVTGQLTEEYQGQTITVHTLRDETYAQQKTLVKGGRREEIQGGLDTTISSGGERRFVNGDKTETINGGLTTMVGANWTQSIGGHFEQKVGQKTWITYGVAKKVHIGANIDVSLVNKDSAVIGARLDLNVGFRTDINVAGVLQYNSAPQVQISPITLSTFGTFMHKAATVIGLASTKLVSGGIRLESNGTTIFN